MGFGESGGDTARAVPPVREGQLGCVRCLQVDGFGEVACSALGDVIREAPVEPLLRAHAAKCGSMGPFRCGEFGGLREAHYKTKSTGSFVVHRSYICEV